MSAASGVAAASAPRSRSASASRSAPSLAAQPPQSVRSVRRMARHVLERRHRPMIRVRRPSVGTALPSTAGADGSRWVPRSSTPVTPHSVRRGGFDSHAFPPGGPTCRRDRQPDGHDRPASRRSCAALRPATSRRRRRGAHRDRPRSGRRRAPATGRGRRRRRPRPPTDLAAEAEARLAAYGRAGVEPVINATGVIVHTNLGRAPWPRVAVEAAAAAAGGYLLLELDRATGRRGARARVAEDHLVALTGAEDALVTNNNAAAVALAVGLAGRGGGVVVSRGELVEIGGGVRIPEIIRRAGARLIEVGTTNRTRAADFEAALAEGRARVVLRVHPVELHDGRLHRDARPGRGRRARPRHGAIVIDDLGQRRPARHGGLRPGPRADPRRAPGGRRGPRHVQRRQARRRAAGRPHRRPRRPRRAGCARTRWPGRCARTRSRWPACAPTLGAVPGRSGHDRDPGLADDRDARSTRSSARAAALATRLGDRDRGSWPSTRPSAAARCPARRCHRSAWRIAGRLGEPAPGGAPGGRRRSSSAASTTDSVVLDLRTVDADAGRGPRRGHRAGARVDAMTVVVGTAGHIDHGKTTLLRALTGIDADRLPEERRRGMTIDVGYAHLTLPTGPSIDFVDVPGHDRLVGNMLVGRRRDRRRAAGRRRRRRAARPDPRAPRPARRPRDRRGSRS